jgi:hypothetical protein
LAAITSMKKEPKIVKKSKAKCNHTDDTPATKLNPFLT